ncbi:MAG: alpha/beta fold hydrolase [Acidimicrobiia bacterium]|nr:alpha/beta fold hydrolase [Acidimicrobiia bacterium]
MTAIVVSAASYAHRRSQSARWSTPGGYVVQTSSLSARVLGDAGLPILLLHGLVASGVYWGGLYDQLADHHRLVVPDLVGFGRSPRPTTGYGPDDHVDALVTCLDELGIDAPVAIGAHSLGALIALRMASIRPERVSAIVAFGPPLYPDPHTARAHVAATSPMGRLFVLPGRTAERTCRWVCDHRRIAAQVAAFTHPGLPREIAADAVQHTWASYSETLQRVILAAEAQGWLSQISCPVHLVAGSSDPVVDLGYLRALADTHDNIVLTVWPGRHDLPITHAEDCLAIIAAS